MNPLPRLHLVTDDAVLADPAFPAIARGVLECCRATAALHVRGHATSGAALHAVAGQLQTVTQRTGAWLLVNDRIDVAMAVGANGVQLGNRSIGVADARALLGTSFHIGYSAHTTDEAARAQSDGADFVVLGTIYESMSHGDRTPAGAGLVAETAVRTVLPVIAIGGVTPGRVAELAAAGAHGAAVLGGVWRAPDPVSAAAAYTQAVLGAWPSAHRGSNTERR